MACDRSRLKANWDAAVARVAAAAVRVGRDAKDVRIVPATKYVDADVCEALVAMGVDTLAENRVQDLDRKASALSQPCTWHFIGHLQRNKARKALQHVRCVQSLDSRKLAEALNRIVDEEEHPPLDVLIEVKTAMTDAAKTGVDPDALPGLVDFVRDGCPHLRLRGFMTMAALDDQGEASRPYFAMLRVLRDRILGAGQWHLSMGMTQDFDIAVEEGATIVRLGSVLFEGV